MMLSFHSYHRRFSGRSTKQKPKKFIFAIFVLILTFILLLSSCRNISSPPASSYEYHHQFVQNQNITSHKTNNPLQSIQINHPLDDYPLHHQPEQQQEQQLAPISVLVLFHNEYPTLEHTLTSWESDLLPHISQIVFFLNGISHPSIFLSKLPRLSNPKWKNISYVHASPQNLRLGIAINQMVKLAKYKHVLLLEKDWALIEPSTVVYPMLLKSIHLLDTHSANVVRFRHRYKPGTPLHARIMHQGREKQMLQQQSNLFCFMHHWIDDPTNLYPKYFHICPSTHNDDHIWCSSSQFCQWTNNPSLFLKDWFLDNLGLPFEKDFYQTIQTDPNSNMLDFEFYANWRFDRWNDRQFTIALPKGLFEHQEIGEQNLMNTVWYAWFRLSTDVTEKKTSLMKTERKYCSSVQKSWYSGVEFSQNFPIDFVRMYHYNQSMQLTNQQAITELKQAIKSFSKRMENGYGTWRNAVTDLTNLWYKLSLYSYPTEPESMNLAFVTMVYGSEFDINNLNTSTNLFNTVAANLDLIANYKLIVYTSKEIEQELKIRLRTKFQWDQQRFNTIVFHVIDQDNMLQNLLTNDTIHRVHNLHSSQEYRSAVQQRNNQSIPSVQNILLRLVKPYLLADSVNRITEVDSLSSITHVIWFNATTSCLTYAGRNADSGLLSKYNDFVFRQHIILNPMVTVRTATSHQELTDILSLSGYDTNILLQHMEQKDITKGVQLADGNTLGGSLIGVNLMAGYYDFVLRDLMRKGQLGTEQEALSIAMKNVDYNFEKVTATCLGEDKKCSEVSYECKIYARAGSCLSL